MPFKSFLKTTTQNSKIEGLASLQSNRTVSKPAEQFLALKDPLPGHEKLPFFFQVFLRKHCTQSKFDCNYKPEVYCEYPINIKTLVIGL